MAHSGHLGYYCFFCASPGVFLIQKNGALKKKRKDLYKQILNIIGPVAQPDNLSLGKKKKFLN